MTDSFIREKQLNLFKEASGRLIERAREQGDPEPTYEPPEPAQRALRYNNGKPRLSLVPMQWVRGLAELCAIGAEKYAVDNWKLSYKTLDHDAFVQDRKDSAYRHLAAMLQGEQRDPETKCAHAVHVAWNALVVWVYEAELLG